MAAALCPSWWLSRYAVAVHRLTRGVGDTVFYAADGRPWFRLDEQRHDVPLAEISPDLQHAVVPSRIAASTATRASIRSASRAPSSATCAAGEPVEGGSTLTQQLARTLFLSNARTYGRKAKEAAIALLIEAQLTKTQILELYLNRVYLSAGVYGVETMSEHLFRKPARALTLPEAALIAGLIRAPSTLSPWSNYDGALERSHVVLAQMREQGFITPEQEAAARAGAAAHSAVPAAARGRAAAGRRIICASSSATSSAAIIRRTGRCTRPSTGACRTRRSKRSRRA